MFEIPTDLSALTDEELAASIEEATAAFNALAEIDDAELSDEQIDEMEALGAYVTSAREQVAEREQAVEARSQRLAAARAAVTPAEEPAEEPVEEATAEPVVAAATRTPITRRAAAAAPQADPPPARQVAVLTAAADVPGFATGGILDDLDSVSKAVVSRMSAFPKTKIGNVFNRYGVATITKPRNDDLVQQSAGRSDMDLIRAASYEDRLAGGSLVAAGGWCAPSETIYDLFSNASTDGLIDLPEVQVNRGGLKFTKGPQFEDVYTDIGFAQTEAEAIAGTPKPCYDVECPAFEDIRLDAVGLCIRAGILTNVGYPELIRNYVEQALIAHQHKVSARVIAAMNTIAGAAVAVANPWPTTISLLTALELVAEGERQRYRLARSQTLEVVLPYWVRTAIRAELSVRTGVDQINVTDAQIDAYFAVRGLRVQFVYNYQPLAYTTNTTVAFPATIEALIYPAGTFVKGSTDVITLDAVYDSTGLETNTYTALFAEEGVLVANVRYAPRRISLATSVTGMTAAAAINEPWGTAQTPVNPV